MNIHYFFIFILIELFLVLDIYWWNICGSGRDIVCYGHSGSNCQQKMQMLKYRPNYEIS